MIDLNVKEAARLYYEKKELRNADIALLFNVRSSATIAKLKSKAKECMAEEGRLCYDGRCVSTDCAYRAWGIDIKDIEKRASKLCRIEKMLNKGGTAV